MDLSKVRLVEPDEPLAKLAEEVAGRLPDHTVMLVVFGPHGNKNVEHKLSIFVNHEEMQEPLLNMLIMHHEREQAEDKEQSH